MRLSLDIDAQEKAEICRWIEQSLTHAVAFAKAEAAWEAGDLLKAKIGGVELSPQVPGNRKKMFSALLVGFLVIGCAFFVVHKMI